MHAIVSADMPAELKQEVAAIEQMQDCLELRKMMIDALSLSVEQIIRLAAIVRRLEELGDDLSDMNFTLLPQLRKVAYGQVLPELVVNLIGKPLLLRKACALPIPDQQRIAADDALKVMESGGDHRMVPVSKMSGRDINQVFGPDCIRDDAEQASWLREKANAKPPTEAKWDREKIYLDRRRQGLVVGKRFIPASDLAHYLSQLTEKAKTPH